MAVPQQQENSIKDRNEIFSMEYELMHNKTYMTVTNKAGPSFNLGPLIIDLLHRHLWPH